MTSLDPVLLDLLACAVQIPMTQVVWTLLQKAVNHAVDYDLRLQADPAAMALAARHDGAVREQLSRR